MITATGYKRIFSIQKCVSISNVIGISHEKRFVSYCISQGEMPTGGTSFR